MRVLQEQLYRNKTPKRHNDIHGSDMAHRHLIKIKFHFLFKILDFPCKPKVVKNAHNIYYFLKIYKHYDEDKLSSKKIDLIRN